jgi:uncharacterized protein YqcC (DUF446 family)
MLRFFRRSKTTEAERDSLGRILAKLDEIEAELKRIGYWENNAPDLEEKVRSGELNSFLDAPSFELWLQQIFVPHARQAAKDNALPKESQVGVMAMRQYDYHTHVPEAQRLFQLLNQFDRLVESHARLRSA